MIKVFDWVTSNAFFGRCAFVFLFQLTLGLVLWLFFNHSLRKRYFSAIPVRDYVENSNISLSLTWEQKQELRRQRYLSTRYRSLYFLFVNLCKISALSRNRCSTVRTHWHSYWSLLFYSFLRIKSYRDSTRTIRFHSFISQIQYITHNFNITFTKSLQYRTHSWHSYWHLLLFYSFCYTDKKEGELSHIATFISRIQYSTHNITFTNTFDLRTSSILLTLLTRN